MKLCKHCGGKTRAYKTTASVQYRRCDNCNRTSKHFRRSTERRLTPDEVDRIQYVLEDVYQLVNPTGNLGVFLVVKPLD